jgi:ABC-2 type transport system ATP-binding protein
MSTPYLDEAERCNRVALMDKGKIISCDTPKNVKDSIHMQVLEIVCNPVRKAYNLIRSNTDYEVQMYGDRLNIALTDYENDYEVIKKLFEENSIEEIDKRTITPSLENVFIHYMSK